MGPCGGRLAEWSTGARRSQVDVFVGDLLWGWSGGLNHTHTLALMTLMAFIKYPRQRLFDIQNNNETKNLRPLFLRPR